MVAVHSVFKGGNLSASYSTVERAIAAIGYTLKKKSLYESERDRVRCAGKAQRMERNIVTGEHPELLSSYTAKDNILPFIAKRAVTCRWMTARQTGRFGKGY